jgi:hypothetical protein
VVDGLGGGIGVAIISRLKEALNGVELIALGSNAVAVERMVKSGADRGAAGENAICQTVVKADFILGPIGIIIPNSMMGEITGKMAESILAAQGKRIIIPLQNEHVVLAGMENLSLSKMIDRAVELVEESLKEVS